MCVEFPAGILSTSDKLPRFATGLFISPELAELKAACAVEAVTRSKWQRVQASQWKSGEDQRKRRG